MTFLIVDDSLAIRKIVMRVVKQACANDSLQFLEAGDGFEALQALNSGRIVNLVLTDINMPNMNGLELIRKLKSEPAYQAWATIPILMVVTEGSQESVKTGLSNGAAGYIRKPFMAQEIREKLASLGIVQ